MGAARSLAVLIALAGVLATRALVAQSDEQLAEARSLFSEALSQEAAGDWAGALEKMQKVARVKLTPQVRYHLARCKEHLGRHTEALGEYRLAEAEAKKADAPELEEISRAREDLESRVPKLVVTLPAKAAGARVTLDGVELGPSQLGNEIPVNPGRHRLVAKLGDREWQKRFKAVEGRIAEVNLKPPSGKGDASAEDERGDAKPAAGEGGSSLPWIAAGVGAVGLIGAGVFYGLHIGAENELETSCRGSVCPESAKETQESSDRYRVLSQVSLGVGAVGLGAATILWLTGGSSSEEKASARIGVAPSGRGVAVRASF